MQQRPTTTLCFNTRLLCKHMAFVGRVSYGSLHVCTVGWLGGGGNRVAAAGATTSTPVARAGERTVSRTRGAKQTDEGKLRKVSGRLFPDSSGRSGGSAVAQGGGDLGGPPRRSSRLSAMATTSERQVRLLRGGLGGCYQDSMGPR
jgi:hypothetical protein